MSSVSATLLIAGRYRLDHQVATDQFGEVWHATDVELARAVAVKLLDADTGDADAVSQFRAAACRAASLTHEGLVRVFDYCEPEPSGAEQRPYQVMEYVDGQPLAAQLQAGPLGAARTADIVAQVSAALHAVHRAALAHGDIRPEKILLRRDGAAKLFGFSGTCPAESAAIGADLRALGVLARECLGEPTSPGEPSASVTDLVAELCAHPSAGHADVTAAIARRAAALRAQLGKAGGDAALSASQSASSTPPAWFLRTASSSLSGRPGDRPPELRQTSVTHGPTLHRHQRRSASPSQQPTPPPSRSPSGSPTTSTSSSPTPSSSPTSSPSPSGTAPPPGSPPPSSTSLPSATPLAG